jgi:RecA/RadA recombinase
MAKKELSFNEKLLAMSEKYKTNLDVEYLDSGSVIVNMVLGGGLPMGKNIEIYSNSGYGKSTITLSVCRALCKQ